MRVVEKRRGDRFLCAGLVEVRWTDPSEGPSKTIANLDDVSSGGISLLLERPMAQGTRVEFVQSGQMVSGDVRHCTRTEIGWIVGLRFGPDSQWDPGAHPPEHLLDPDSFPEDAHLSEGQQLSREVQSTISCLVLGEAVRREDG